MADEKKKALEIVIDDGSQRVPIKNLDGEEIGVFRFHPTDIGIIQRYNDQISHFGDIVAPLEELSITADGTVDENDKAALEALNEAEQRLYKACNYIFGGNMSEAFFGSMHPFSPIGGVFYCEIALTNLGAFITEQFNTETKKIDSRVNKYTAKYNRKAGKK